MGYPAFTLIKLSHLVVNPGSPFQRRIEKNLTIKCYDNKRENVVTIFYFYTTFFIVTTFFCLTHVLLRAEEDKRLQPCGSEESN